MLESSKIPLLAPIFPENDIFLEISGIFGHRWCILKKGDAEGAPYFRTFPSFISDIELNSFMIDAFSGGRACDETSFQIGEESPGTFNRGAWVGGYSKLQATTTLVCYKADAQNQRFPIPDFWLSPHPRPQERIASRGRYGRSAKATCCAMRGFPRGCFYSQALCFLWRMWVSQRQESHVGIASLRFISNWWF